MPEFESAVTTRYNPVDGAAITLVDESSTVKTLVRSDRAQFDVSFRIVDTNRRSAGR